MTDEQLGLTDDGARALQEAQNFCWRANIAIVAAEHVLAGALLVLSQSGASQLPAKEALEAALAGAQGLGEPGMANQVMFGSAARDAINTTAGGVRAAGGTQIDARLLAAGVIESGEVNPMFFSALGRTKAEILASIAELGRAG